MGYNMDNIIVNLKKQIQESGGSGGTTDYEDLEKLPQINSVELKGDKSLEDLGIDAGAIAYDNEVSGLTGDTIQEAIDEVNAKTVISGSYITTGLTTENCTIKEGGYCKIGNLVIVNMRLTKSESGAMRVAGLPTYGDSNTPNIVPASAYNMTDETHSDITYSAINSLGVLSILSTTVAYKDIAIMATYLSNANELNKKGE